MGTNIIHTKATIDKQEEDIYVRHRKRPRLTDIEKGKTVKTLR